LCKKGSAPPRNVPNREKGEFVRKIRTNWKVLGGGRFGKASSTAQASTKKEGEQFTTSVVGNERKGASHQHPLEVIESIKSRKKRKKKKKRGSFQLNDVTNQEGEPLNSYTKMIPYRSREKEEKETKENDAGRGTGCRARKSIARTNCKIKKKKKKGPEVIMQSDQEERKVMRSAYFKKNSMIFRGRKTGSQPSRNQPGLPLKTRKNAGKV